MAGYTRNDTANNIADGNVINASDLDGEYNAIEAAFNESTGHSHDGTSAEGAPITVVGPVQDVEVSATTIQPKTASAGQIDLGASGAQFKDLFIDGLAYIDGLGENLLVNSTNEIQFRDSALKINSSADGQLDIDADTELELTSPIVDINASTSVNISNDLKLDSDSAILSLGADSEVTLTHLHNVGTELKVVNATTSSVTDILDLQVESSGTPAVGIGTGLTFSVETAGGNVETAGAVRAIATGLTPTAEEIDLVFYSMRNGSLTEAFRYDSDADTLDVTGTVTADGATFNGNITIDRGATASNPRITFDQDLLSGSNFIEVDRSSNNFVLKLNTQNKLQVDDNGNISFYENTGSDAKFFWDASAERVNVGNLYLGEIASNYDKIQATSSAGLRLQSSGGSVYLDSSGNLGINTSSPEGLISFPATASNTPKFRLQSATSNVDVAISSYADANGTYASFGANHYLNSSGNDAAFDATKRSAYVFVDGRNLGGVVFGTGASGTATERMRIDSSGNVGIGCSPAYPLEVAGSFPSISILDTDTTNDRFRILHNGGSSQIQVDPNNVSASSSLLFSIDGSEKVRLDANGNVGVNVTPPSDMYSGVKTIQLGHEGGGIFTANTIANGTVSIGLNNYFNSSLQSVYATSNAASQYAQVGGEHRWRTAPSGTAGNAITFTQAMTLDASGDLLIGTTDTAVYDNSTASSASNGHNIRADGKADHARYTTSATAAVLGLNRVGSDGYLAEFRKDGVNVGAIGSRSSGTALQIFTSNTGIDFGGDGILPMVGSTITDNSRDIGSSSYRFKDLYLSGKSFADTYQFAQNSSAVGATEAIYRPTTGAIAFKASSTERMRIDANGSLLIGTQTQGNTHAYFQASTVDRRILSLGCSTPGAAGLVLFKNTNGTVGDIVVSGTSTSYNTSSDYRLKENVVDMTGAVDRVKALNPSQFNFIADPDTTVDGFLAHEVADVVPEAVTGTKDAMQTEEYEVTPAVLDDDGNVVTEAVMGTREVPDYQGIDQSKLVPLLTGALQEAIARIETLEAQVATLQGN